eukprot:403336695
MLKQIKIWQRKIHLKNKLKGKKKYFRNTSNNNLAGNSQSFISTSQLLKQEKQEQLKLQNERKKEEDRAIFKKVASVRNLPKSQFLNTFYSGIPVASPTSNFTKPTTAGSFGNVLSNAQTDFLKAYTSKVKWQPPLTAGPQNQCSEHYQVYGQMHQTGFKNKREMSISDTISKVKQFQLQEHDLRDNNYYMEYINDQIESKLKQSVEKEKKIQKLFEDKNQFFGGQTNQSLIKQLKSQAGINSVSMLSLAETPNDSLMPIHKISLLEGFNTSNYNAQGNQNFGEQILTNKADSKKIFSKFNTQKLKETKFRSTSTANLKTLMKSPNDLKLQVFRQAKEENSNNIRDQGQRTDLASDLMMEDKIIMHQNQIANFYGRDISFKDDGVSKQFISHIQRSQSQDTLQSGNINNIISQPSTITQNQEPKMQINNISNYPQSLDKLKEMTEIFEFNSKLSMNTLIDKKNIIKVPDTFFISTSRISSELQKHQKQLTQDQLLNQSQLILQKHTSFKKLQDHLSSDIKQEQLTEEQTQIYRKREQELLLSLEKLNLSSRVDTLALQDWLAKMIIEIRSYDNSLSELQKFELTQFIYNMTFIELAKQVSLHCSERGNLMQSLWSAFLELMNVQLRHIRAEKNILERETVVSLGRFHDHYETQVQDYRESTLKMFKESQNYKRSYERLRKDFEALQTKTSKIGQQLQELTIMYKQKCSRVDFLERTNNNLQGIIQTLQEQSEDEDPNMMDDDYFKKEKKKPKVVIDLLDIKQNQRTRKQSENELGYLQSLDIQSQYNFIDKVGNDVGDFLVDSEVKREKEDIALENADLFAAAMRGEFFKDKDIQVRMIAKEDIGLDSLANDNIGTQEKQKLQQLIKRKTLIESKINDKDENSNEALLQYDDEFYQYLIDEKHLINMGTEIVNDLIITTDAETLVNEDIILEDTGINLRAQDQQKFVDRILFLEMELNKLQTELQDTNQKLDFQMTFNDLQKDKIEMLEKQISKKTEELEKYFLEIETLQEEMSKIREEKMKFESKCRRMKSKIEDYDSINQELNEQLVQKQKQIEEQRHLIEIHSPLSIPKGQQKHLKTNSLSSIGGGDGSIDYEEYEENDGSLTVKNTRKRRNSKNFSNGSNFFPFGNIRDRSKFKFMEFQLGRRKERHERAHPSQQAFEKFKKKSKIKNIMPKTLLLKTITQTYLDLIELHSTQRMPPIIPYIYDQMMHKYGIKKIGYDKFIQLLGTTVKMAPQCLRISLFGRLLRIVKPNYDTSDIKIYIEVAAYLHQLNIGVKIDNIEGDDQHFTPLVRAQECLRFHFESKIPIDEWAELKKRLEGIRRADPKSVNKMGIVEVDEFIDLVLNQYHRLETLAAEKVNQLFLATDFNGNAFISCDEFITSYRNVVQDNWGKEYGILLFQDYMEEVYDKENNCSLFGISFDSFLKAALEMDILKVKDQNKFLSPLDIDKQFGELLQQLWKKEKNWKQKLKFLGLDSTNSEWLENIEMCSKQIKEEILPKRVLLLRSKLIDEETQNMVADHYLDQFFSNDLNAFIKVAVEEAYTNDYYERNVLSNEQIKEKKKQAGLAQPQVKKDEYGISILEKDETGGDYLLPDSENQSPKSKRRKKASKKGKKTSFIESLNTSTAR